jgi:hypothetical protein
MEKIKEIFRYLEAQKRYLTPYQLDFVNSLKKYFKARGTLSVRQIESLESIRKYMRLEA